MYQAGGTDAGDASRLLDHTSAEVTAVRDVVGVKVLASRVRAPGVGLVRTVGSERIHRV